MFRLYLPLHTACQNIQITIDVQKYSTKSGFNYSASSEVRPQLTATQYPS